jgi:hypothetical protein
MAAGDYELACGRFRDSDRLDPAVGTRFNLADCEERRGRVATAWSLFRGVASELAVDDDRAPIAHERVRALERRLPYLLLVRTPQTPSGARARVDGAELGEASFGVALPMDPGSHELVILTQGKQERQVFLLREGQRSEVPVRFTPLPRPTAAANGNARETWGYVAGGVGVAGVLTGSVAGIVTLGKKSTANEHCDDDLRVCDATGRDANRSGKTFAVVSGVGFGVGIVGVATGVYLLLTAPAKPARAAHVGPHARGSLAINPQLDWVNGTGFLSLTTGF